MSILSVLFQKGKTVHFKKGEFFMSPNKRPQGVYLLTEGFLISYSESDTNKKRIQTILKKGDTFPLAWAINNEKRNIYLEALTDGTAQVIEKEIFLDHITHNHEATLEMVSVLLMYLSTYVDRVDNLEYDKVREKVISRIIFFANRFGIKKEKRILIDLPITHKLIAESISVSRENVTRELKNLGKKKLITFKNRQLVVLDLQALKDEL